MQYASGQHLRAPRHRALAAASISALNLLAFERWLLVHRKADLMSDLASPAPASVAMQDVQEVIVIRPLSAHNTHIPVPVFPSRPCPPVESF
jgi:hypothetical protein